jgi:pilus assembly protein CpaE
VIRSTKKDVLERSRAFWSAEDGVSAIEFALVAPVFVLSVVVAMDIGLAVSDRTTIDHVLRAGAQSAMEGKEAAEVLKVLQATSAKNFSSSAPLTVAAERVCACPEASGTPVGCLTTCSGSAPPSIFVRLSASRTYKGVILPDIALNPSKQVQVR